MWIGHPNRCPRLCTRKANRTCLKALKVFVPAEPIAGLAGVNIERMTRRLVCTLPAALLAAPMMPTRSELARYRQALEKTLLLSQPKDAAVKGIVGQGQMLCFYSRMARSGHEPKAMLAAAEQGFVFLRDQLWDAKYGGFVWELDGAGKASKSNKHLYGQALGLCAVAEYALASGRKDVLGFALKCFENMEKRAHDSVHGGYVEYFLTDWSTPPANEPSYVEGSGPGIKTMSTHLQLLEAVTSLYRVAKQPAIRERLLELMSIESNAVLRKESGACTDKYSRDWTPLLDGELALVNYGQNLKNVSVLAEAARVAAVALSPFVDLFEANFAYCRKHGFDERAGGFRLATGNATKIGWVQDEALAASLLLYKLTGKTDYFEVFRKTWGFCEGNFKDWQHDGRAVLEATALLDSLKEKAQ
jgi:cellobiose epimerase